jgi:hypothetical protein
MTLPQICAFTTLTAKKLLPANKNLINKSDCNFVCNHQDTEALRYKAMKQETRHRRLSLHTGQQKKGREHEQQRTSKNL